MGNDGKMNDEIEAMKIRSNVAERKQAVPEQHVLPLLSASDIVCKVKTCTKYKNHKSRPESTEGVCHLVPRGIHLREKFSNCHCHLSDALAFC